MYDPDNPKPKPVLGNLTQQQQPPRPAVQIMSEKDRLRYYLLQDPGIRERFGFEMGMNRRLVIKDVKKLERLDAETKAILRELYQELK